MHGRAKNEEERNLKKRAAYEAKRRIIVPTVYHFIPILLSKFLKIV